MERLGKLKVKEVGWLHVQKFPALKVLELKRLPSSTRFPAATFWLSELRDRHKVPIAPSFQFILGRRVVDISSVEVIVI